MNSKSNTSSMGQGQRGAMKGATRGGERDPAATRGRWDSSSRTRHIEQPDKELHGGRERSERRGGSAVSSVHAAARHPRARSH